MLLKIKNILKEYKKTIIYLLKLNKDKTLLDVLKMVILIRKIKERKKRINAILDIKKSYYKNILKKEIEVKLGKRIGASNAFVKLRLKKNNGIIYNLRTKEQKKRQRIINFELISKDNLKKYRSLFLYAFNKKKKIRQKLKKVYNLKNYEKFFIWPFLITIKPGVIIIKNIFFKNYFILKYKKRNKILFIAEFKNKYKSAEILLNKINILNTNILNNYFRQNNLFILKKGNIINKVKNYKNSILKLYLNVILYKNINNFYTFLNIIKKTKIKIKENFFNDLLKTLIFFFKRKKCIKIYKNNNFNLYFWNKNNKVFNKTIKNKKNSFYNYKNYIKKYTRRSIISYSFFLRLYALYFFWFLFFFNKIFYYFNKILFNFWFRFFYFLYSSLNFNSKLFFSFNKLYKNVYLYNKNINFYFEFENIFINYLNNIKNIFYSNIKYVYFNKKNNLFLYNFILNNIFFIFKNYFFSNINVFYSNFLKNIINKSFKLENNLFDILYSSNYNYNNIYNKEYFLINGYICKKYKFRYKASKKRKNKLSKIDLINFEKLEEKKKKTLFLY